MADISARSSATVTHTLKGIDFPATKDKVIAFAREHDASPDVLDVLNRLPEREYGNMAELMKGYGEEK
jgi:hypothetical protein